MSCKIVKFKTAIWRLYTRMSYRVKKKQIFCLNQDITEWSSSTNAMLKFLGISISLLKYYLAEDPCSDIKLWL